MALLSSPRKQTVPLATGDERPSLWRKTVQPAYTKRVFFCSVVVENPGDGYEFPSELQDFVAQFGDPLDLDGESNQANASSSSTTDILQAGNEPYVRKRHTSTHSNAPSTNESLDPAQPTAPPTRAVNRTLPDVIKELVTTERSYVQRLRILRDDYAKPLREYSRTKDTLIIPPYEAKVLFGNIDQILPVNEALLQDLEKVVEAAGGEFDDVAGIAEVALKHFRDLRGFESYRQYYIKREEGQAIFEREIRKGSGLATFIDRIKYASADTRNRVGLRELLMDPVQRIPRYTLLFREMAKRLDPADPVRAKLVEADELAAIIAKAAPDEQTTRAAIMYCFNATIEDFPANITSNSRKFIDCIDVDDVLAADRWADATGGATTPGGGAGVLHCSLLLFDDKLVILKRPSSEKGVRALTGLDNLEKSNKTQPFTIGLKKSGIQYKGMVDLTEVVSTDVGGADFHLYLEALPISDSERWSGRPFRSYSVVHPPSPVNLDPKRTDADKRRFLDNLWTAQARYRTRSGQSVVVASEDQQLENVKGRLQIAKTYFNIYQRTAFLQEPKKTKIVVQIDPVGTADPIPFGSRGPPYVVVRVQPMAGELSRYSVTSNNPDEDDDNDGEEDIVQSSRVPDRIVQTIHSFGLFKFRTGNLSMPGTPTASVRSKVFGLDALSRGLFHAKSASARATITDVFGAGGAANAGAPSIRRAKTTMSSRTSVHTTSSGESSLSRFTRSRSNSTSATTASLHNSSMSSRHSRSSQRSGSMGKAAKKLIKRKTPPAAASDGSESERESRESAHMRSMSAPVEGEFGRAPSAEPETDYSDYYEDLEDPPARGNLKLNESERDLMLRLRLARQNSQSQHEAQFDALAQDLQLEETIYESEWDDVRRPDSRASYASSSRDRELPSIPTEERKRIRSTGTDSTTRPNSTTPTKDSDRETSRSRASSRNERRLHGPRSISPSPRPKTPVTVLPSMEDELAEEDAANASSNASTTPRRPAQVPSPLPRSKRQPFEQAGYVDATPRASGSGSHAATTVSDDDPTRTRSVEPLVIRRKSSMQFHSGRRKYHNGQRTPSMTKVTSTSVRRVSSSINKHPPRATAAAAPPVPQLETPEEVKHLISLTTDAKQQIDSARVSVKRMKEDYERMIAAKDTEIASLTASTVGPSSPTGSGIGSPVKVLKTPPRLPPSTAKTREAQERMNEMLRLIKHRQPSGGSDSRSGSPAPSKSLKEYTAQVETELSKAVQNQDDLAAGIKALGDLLATKTTELERYKAELQHSRTQKELVKTLLEDSMAEKEIMYDSFNEELDAMFRDVQLPMDEAFEAMAEDLHIAAATAKTLEKEKALLQHQLADANNEKEELRSLLRLHGLIS